MEKLIDVIQVVLVSALPVLELRVGLPLALFLGFSKRWALFYGVLGNTIGLFLAFIILDHLMPWLGKIKLFQQIYLYSTNRIHKKGNRHKQMRYLGLFILVAIPLPGTGAWTAALVSYLFKFERWKALLVIFAGIITLAAFILFVGVIGIHGYKKIY